VVADGVRIPAGLRLARRVVTLGGTRDAGADDGRAADLLLSPLDAKRRRG
jgi:hypothetical protein